MAVAAAGLGSGVITGVVGELDVGVDDAETLAARSRFASLSAVAVSFRASTSCASSSATYASRVPPLGTLAPRPEDDTAATIRCRRDSRSSPTRALKASAVSVFVPNRAAVR